MQTYGSPVMDRYELLLFRCLGTPAWTSEAVKQGKNSGLLMKRVDCAPQHEVIFPGFGLCVKHF
jgi:hypothetical protein